MDRREVDIESQPHKMWAEGKHDEKPSTNEIEALLKDEGYEAGEIDISYDNMMKLWTWHCKIAPLVLPKKVKNNVYHSHPMMINSGTFWRCDHGKTGFAKDMEWIGCEECAAADPEAAANHPL